MEFAGPRARDRTDLAARIAAKLRTVAATQNLEFRQRVDTWVSEERPVGSAIQIVHAVQGPVVRSGPIAIHRKHQSLKCAVRTDQANVRLI